jgi:hypothetical protein
MVCCFAMFVCIKPSYMHSCVECQEQNKIDFMNPRFGMVQTMNKNLMCKLGPLMEKPMHEGKVMLNTNDKPQSMREMLLVSP